MGDLSIQDLGPAIARGRTAEIYAWHDGQVLKLFHTWMPQAAVEEEAAIARAVHASGLPVPAVGDVVQVGDRWGLGYERIEGQSLLSGLEHRPWQVPRAFRQLATLHRQVHAHCVPGLRSLKERLAVKIARAELPGEDIRERALFLLQDQPAGDTLCHGDFHPDNILITSLGPVIIDWIDAAHGDPAADVARTLLLLSGGAPPPGVRFGALMAALRRIAQRTYLSAYERHAPGIRERASAWLPVVAAGRLSEGIQEEQVQLQSLVRRHLGQ